VALNCYYYYYRSTEPYCHIEKAEVRVNGETLAAHPLCPSENNSAWTAGQVDLSGYAGQEITLSFYLENDAISDPSTLLLDDVALGFRSTTPLLRASPTRLSFLATEGGEDPAPRSRQVTNAGQGDLEWTATEVIDWLALSATSGSAPSTVGVTAEIGDLDAGSYAGQITVQATGAGGSPRTIDLSLLIRAPGTETRIYLPLIER
jgi:hypothetical protein